MVAEGLRMGHLHFVFQMRCTMLQSGLVEEIFQGTKGVSLSCPWSLLSHSYQATTFALSPSPPPPFVKFKIKAT